MNINFDLSSASVSQLNKRGLNQQQIQNFEDLVQQAKTEQKQTDKSAKQVLAAMTPQQLAILQRANSIASPIQVNQLSEEGAANLLSQPDRTDRVDLNNDGIIEIGQSRSIQFPPPSAPESIKQSWQEATEVMDWGDKAILEMRMHSTVYGFQIEGQPNKTPLSPQTQWSTAGVADLLSDLRSNLQFRVNHDGWTEENKAYQTFINTFEQAIEKNRSLYSNAVNLPGSYQAQPEQQNTDNDFDLMQSILDARLGIDRERLKEIEAEIAAIAKNPALSAQEKQKAIEALEKEKESLLEDAQKRTAEKEKIAHLESTASRSLHNQLTDKQQKAQLLA